MPWNPISQEIRVYFNCLFRLSANIDLIGDIFDGESLVWWGFTASTGGLNNVGQRKNMSIWKVDYVDPLNIFVPSRAKMIILEDNDAVISTVIKGRSLALRHVSRTQRIALDWLLERLREDNSMTLRYVKTRDQSADFLTKASFSSPQWDHLLKLNGLYPKFPPAKRTCNMNWVVTLGGTDKDTATDLPLTSPRCVQGPGSKHGAKVGSSAASSSSCSRLASAKLAASSSAASAPPRSACGETGSAGRISS